MIARLYRYVVFRLSRQQRAKIPDSRLADLRALMSMTFPPLMVLTALYIRAYKSAEYIPRFERGSAWLAGGIAVGIIYVFNYIALGDEEKFSNLHREFAGTDPYGKWGTWIAWSFFLIPFAALIASALL